MKHIFTLFICLFSLSAMADPTLKISASTNTLNVGETATVTFEFSKSVTGFALDDVVAKGGISLVPPLSGSGSSYTLTVQKTSPETATINVGNNTYAPSGNGANYGFNHSPLILMNSGALFSSAKIKAVGVDGMPPRCPLIGERLVTTATGLPASKAVESYYTMEWIDFKRTWEPKAIRQGCLTRVLTGQSWAYNTALKASEAASVHAGHNHGTSMIKVSNQEIPIKVGTTKIRLRPNNHDCNQVNQTGHCTDFGAFRTGFESAVMMLDDPILYPNQKGASHHHTVYGNASVNYQTTTASLIKNCNSVAAGGIWNCTGYWQPSMIDTATNTALDPSLGILVYYKASISGLVEPLPQGLKIIAGKPSATSEPNLSTDDKISYLCLNRSTGATYPGGGPKFIPSCKAPLYTEMMASVIFPNCVADNGSGGMVLDSANHRSHLVYGENPANGTHTNGNPLLANGCPTNFPHLIPNIQVNATFPIRRGQDTATWRLSSDNYSMSLPSGYSLHADWWGGWDNIAAQRMVDACNNTNIDCGTNYFGLNTGVAISSITTVGTTATITTAQPHRLPIGDQPYIQTNFAGNKLLGRLSGVTGTSAAVYNFDPESTLNKVGGKLIPVGSQPMTVINATQIQITLPSTPASTVVDVSNAKLQWGESLCQMNETGCFSDYYNQYYPVGN